MVEMKMWLLKPFIDLILEFCTMVVDDGAAYSCVASESLL